MKSLDINAIMRLLPHRPPFLLIDKVIDYEYKKFAISLKNVSINESFFAGHFPGHPVMPGVLILEAMAQTSAIIGLSSSDEQRSEGAVQVYFVKANDTVFRSPVGPGDVLQLHSQFVRARLGMWEFLCEARVEGALVASSKITATIR